MPTITLPEGAALRPFEPSPPRSFAHATPPFPRIAYAAAHVVADPLAEQDPWLDTGNRLGPHDRVPPLSLVARPRRRRGDGHRAARHGARLAGRPRTDPPQPRRGARRAGRADRQRRRHRPSRPGPRGHHRRRDPRLRGAVRGGRSHGRTHHPDGVARPGQGRARPGRLRAGLWPHPLAGVQQPVIIHWLGEMFDPALDGYWGHHDPAEAMERGARRASQATPDKVDGIKISPARRPEGDRHAPPPAARRPHVHRRRFQLRRADRRRRRGPFRRAARHLRPDRPRRGRRAGGAVAQRPQRPSTTSWRRPCRSRATSSRRPRGSTRPAWCSWPG